MSRTSFGGLPEGGFFANARNSLASCGERSGRRRTKYLLCGIAIGVLYTLPLAFPGYAAVSVECRDAGSTIRCGLVPLAHGLHKLLGLLDCPGSAVGADLLIRVVRDQAEVRNLAE
jgi:hypothetical protein